MSPARRQHKNVPSVLTHELPAHVVGRHFFKRLRLPNGGGSDQHVEPSESGHRLVKQPFNLRFLGHIGLKRRGPNALPFQFHCRLPRLVGRAVVVQRDVVSAIGQRHRHGIADASFSAAGNQCDFGVGHKRMRG